MKQGFTLVEIMIVVAIIGLLAAIAIPSFMRARTTSQQNGCINNLRQVEAAKEQWALEKGRTNGATVAWTDIGPVGTVAGYVKQYPLCPAGTNLTRSSTSAAIDYTIGTVGSNCVCSIMAVTHVLQ